MYVSVKHLKLIHYYYFAMGIFAIANAMILGLESFFSVLFIGFYIANSVIAWYIAFVSRKKMRDYLVVNSKRFFINHVAITLASVGIAIFIWTSAIISDIIMLNYILFINYFVMFFAGIWFIFTKTDFVRELIKFYDNRVFRKSKEYIVRIKHKYPRYFGREIASDHEIISYKYGTNSEIDDNLKSAWENRDKKRYVLDCMGRIQLELARISLSTLKERINDLRISKPAPENSRLISQSEREYQSEENDIMEFEKAFFRRSFESKPISQNPAS